MLVFKKRKKTMYYQFKKVLQVYLLIKSFKNS